MSVDIMAPTTRSRNAAPPRAQGTLGSVLTSYDRSHKNPQESSPSSHAPVPGSLTIDVPDPTRMGEDDRERSLTLGSFGDLHSIVMGKDGRGLSFSGLIGGDEHMSEGTAATAVSGSTSSTHHSAHAAAGHADTLLPQLPEHGTAAQSQSVSIPVKTKTGEAATSRARGDSTASQFFNGLMQQPLPPPPQRGQGQPISHTPPTQMGTSYENSHFGKRMRAGSISGRLRSMSDLEDTGVISREQKAILKDLIIAGDSNVQGAIDKYEAGDPSALEAMVKSGAFARSSDVDLLGDLDLDFLNMHGDESMMFGNVEEIGGSAAVVKQPQSDGIGDLEFNGEYAHPGVEPEPVSSMMYRRPRGDSVDDINVHRMRANSLAFPGSFLDGDEASHASFGRWTDKTPHQHALPSNECDSLMASKFRGNDATKKPPKAKKGRPRKDKKEKKEARDRKSQSKAKGPMEGIASGNVDDGEPKEVASGLGRPRSMSDPNLSVRLDDRGLLRVTGPEGWVGAYSPSSRQLRINKFLEKRQHRVWSKKVKYDVRKNFADSRLRVKGRFVKKEDEMLMRELMSLT